MSIIVETAVGAAPSNVRPHPAGRMLRHWQGNRSESGKGRQCYTNDGLFCCSIESL
jgi:hypothetical protein